jgi:hypothetical protein
MLVTVMETAGNGNNMGDCPRYFPVFPGISRSKSAAQAEKEEVNA